ncbi:TPA: MBL fold metallo-hydrolase [Legionella pneumophila]|nr:MBL fold metallo-hydrolase [Legionella pneumophila]
MKANIHFFDVSHGDSIVIEYILEESSHFIVIDCNYSKRVNTRVNPAFEFLKKKNVQNIDAVVLTHLHADHYTGMDEILNEFEVNKILIPPFLSLKSGIFNKEIDKIKAKIIELISRTNDELILKRSYSLANIIHFLSNNEDKIIEANGPENAFRLPFSSEPLGNILLPLPRVKGRLRQMISAGNFELDSFGEMNDASVVLLLNIGKNKIIFGADSTESQWLQHARQLKNDGVICWDSNMLKAPHHGSKHNNTKKLYDYLLTSHSDNYVFISAEGKKHPHDEIFDLIVERNMLPYCTGLARQCLGSNISSIAGLARIPKQFRPMLSSYEIEDLPVACQGDITIEISDISTKIYSSTGNSCIYRLSNPAPVKKLI